MARIRTVKPAFFRHEALFEAERESGLPLRLAFAGLWTIADREGRFRWQPRVIKLDVLPYDEVDFEAILDALADHGFIVKYRTSLGMCAHIPSFAKHQQVNVREAASEIPAPDETSAEMEVHQPKQVHARARTGQSKGAHRTAPVQDRGEQEQEQEGKGKGKGKGKEDIAVSLRSTARSIDETSTDDGDANGTTFDIGYFIEPAPPDDGLTEAEAAAMNAKIGAPPPATGAPERTVEPDEDATPRKRPKTPKPAVDKLKGFEEFWLAYPKKEGRLVAQQSWPRALALPGVTPEFLMAALEEFKKHPPGEAKYWPRASTWLNQQRWNDDYGSAEAATPRRKSSHELMVESLNEIVAERSGRAGGGGPDHSGPAIDGERAE